MRELLLSGSSHVWNLLFFFWGIHPIGIRDLKDPYQYAEQKHIENKPE